MTANELRRELSARNLALAERRPHEVTFGAIQSVIYADEASGSHGNFFPPSWRRIQARSDWRRRLEKTYTASRRVARRHDRWRGELECGTSSDALLMNIVCCPGVLRRPALRRLLGIDGDTRARFGVRIATPLARGLADRTEVDLVLGDLLIEAKLTETGFQVARPSLLGRYPTLNTVFDVAELPRNRAGAHVGYQLIRGMLAAHTQEARFALLYDGRRADLVEQWFHVLRAVRNANLRSRLLVLTWQELSSTVSGSLQDFLEAKYGILPAS